MDEWRASDRDSWVGAVPEDYRAAVTDGASGLFVRAYLQDVLAREFAFAARHGTQLSLALAGLEGLEDLRSQWGDKAHGAVLAEVARRLRGAVRSEELLATWRPGTFALLLRDVNGTTARLVAERLRRVASAAPVEWEGLSFEPRLAVGVATVEPDASALARELVTAAEEHLDRAVEAGGNRVHPAL